MFKFPIKYYDDNIIFKENKSNMIDIEFSDIYL